MSFFKVNKSLDAVRETTSEYIKESGMYPITIQFASVNQGERGSLSVDFNIDYKGSSTTIYGLRLTNNDGSDNFQKAVFNKLLVILGIDTLDDPTIETHMVGKDNTPKEFSVLTELSDQEVIIRLQYEYSKYNGEIKESRSIKNFYRASDKATASEILNGTEVGKQYTKDLAYASNVTYKDGLTAEIIAEWKEAKKSGTEFSAKTTAKPVTNPFDK